jgi:hypothetical protein
MTASPSRVGRCRDGVPRVSLVAPAPCRRWLGRAVAGQIGAACVRGWRDKISKPPFAEPILGARGEAGIAHRRRAPLSLRSRKSLVLPK